MAKFAQEILSGFNTGDPNTGAQFFEEMTGFIPTVEKLMFDRSVITSIREMLEDGTTTVSFIEQNVHLPLDDFWCEWTPGDSTMGELFQKLGVMVYPKVNGVHRMTVCGLLRWHGAGCILAHGRWDEGDVTGLSMDWFAGDHPAPSCPELERYKFKRLMEAYTSLVMGEFMINCFAMILPKVTKQVEIKYGPKIQRKRQKAGKPPLVEYKTVNIDLAVVKPVYDGTVSEGDGGKHRLHSVVGHIRSYRKGREKPLLSFVPPHWRGDPALGMVLRDRNVNVTLKGKLNGLRSDQGGQAVQAEEAVQAPGDHSVQRWLPSSPTNSGEADVGD